MFDISRLTTIQIIFYSLVIIFYFVKGFYLFKINFLTTGKRSVLPWIPFFSYYLLGKFTFNGVVGVVLLVAIFITNSVHFLIGSFEINIQVLDDGTQLTLFPIVLVVVLALFVLLIMKYNSLKRSGVNVKVETDKSIPKFNKMQIPIQALPSVDQYGPTVAVNTNAQNISTIDNVINIKPIEATKELTEDQKILGTKVTEENAVPIGGFKKNIDEKK